MTARGRQRVAPGRLQDYEAVNALARQVHDLHVAWRPDIFQSVSHPMAADRYAGLCGGGRVYVLRKREAVLAYAVVDIQEMNLPGLLPRRVLKLEELCVDAACRRQGIGKAMLEFLEDLGRQWSCTDLQLTVDPHNEAAIAFYEAIDMRPKVVQYQKKL